MFFISISAVKTICAKKLISQGVISHSCYRRSAMTLFYLFYFKKIKFFIECSWFTVLCFCCTPWYNFTWNKLVYVILWSFLYYWNINYYCQQTNTWSYPVCKYFTNFHSIISSLYHFPFKFISLNKVFQSFGITLILDLVISYILKFMALKICLFSVLWSLFLRRKIWSFPESSEKLVKTVLVT